MRTGHVGVPILMKFLNSDLNCGPPSEMITACAEAVELVDEWEFFKIIFNQKVLSLVVFK